MAFKTYQPVPILAPYVDSLWDYDNLIGNKKTSLTILPDTATYLCFLYEAPLNTTHRHGSYSTRSGLAGFQSFRNDLGGVGKISGVSARLTAWGMNVFKLGVITECAERRVDCKDIFPQHTIERIEEHLARLKTAEARVEYIQNFLLSILNIHQEDFLIRRACELISKARGICPIGNLAHDLELGKRTFERRFFNHIGTTPKRYAKVTRLRHALLNRRFFSSWAEVALEAGYYDQSHMIHDFVELYGYSPETIYPKISLSSTIQFSGLLNIHP